MQALSCDIAVVGHGAAGLAAALAAAEASPGARIAVLERAPEAECGGGSRWSPSNMRLRSAAELAPGFEDDMMAASGGRGERAYFRRLAEDAVPTLAWLAQHGVAFHSPGYYLSSGPPRIQPVGGGAAIVAALARAARSAGVEFHYGCRAERLVRGPAGEISGVEATTDGGIACRARAQAVVLASGGFQGNGAMLREHFGPGGESLVPISKGSGFNAGEGIRMALDAGASVSGDWGGMHSEPVDPRSTGPAPVVLVYPYGIVVDRSGRRMFDEGRGLVHETWEEYSRAIHFAAPGRKAWAILDARLRDIAGHERAIRSEVPPIEAGTLGELAALAGIAPQGLADTVAAYNAACTADPAGFDATRADGLAAAAGLAPPKSNWARALSVQPYLAYPLIGAIAYTFGGVATDTEARVLGPDGPIAGLYAAGEMTGHFYGTAPNAVAVLRALVYGRIAGRAAAARLESNQPNPDQPDNRQAR
ncbi:MAG: FAD-dependent oxidoreductase [Proteobacteria bacterium]|nr:FAD-dependent oxidoreductase [Pseudomonadota bacterium]